MPPENPVAKRVRRNDASWYTQPGAVYFVLAGSECKDCKSVKIGVTIWDRLLSRLKAIQSANHSKIRLYRVISFATMREAEAREQELHKMFQDIQRQSPYTVGAEWFTATRELIALIEKEGRTIEEANPDLKGAVEISRLFVLG